MSISASHSAHQAPTFVHLRTHSSYSLLEGAIQIQQLIDKCKAEGMPAIALTDSGNLFGALEFSMTASKKGIQPIVGGLFNLDPGVEYRSSSSQSEAGSNDFDQILLIAKNPTGYRNLLKLASGYFLDNVSGGQQHIPLAKLATLSEGIIALTAGPKGTVGKLLLANRRTQAEQFLEILNKIFPNHLYIELMRHGLPEEAAIEKDFIEFGLRYNVPFIATNEIYFLDPSMHKAHEVLLCIADGKYLHEEDRRQVTTQHYFKSAAEMAKLFADIPEAIENTVILARRCSVKADERPIGFPHYELTRTSSYEDELRVLAEEGLRTRLADIKRMRLTDASIPEPNEQVYWDKLNYELDVIIRMNFASYILIVADFVRWAKGNDIPVGPGRGSGAGSVINWALGIVDTDPIRFKLFFERFLNPERISLPDIDMDFCQDRRMEVVHYVRKKYGEKRVAHIITFGKLQARAVLRDVGRALQVPYAVVDRIAKLVPFNAVSPVNLAQAIEIEPELKRQRDQDPMIAELIDIALKLEGLYRHVSIHAGGIVIADQDLENLVPLYKDDKSEMLVIQYSMKYAEAAGLIKFDFLGVKTLTMLANCEKLIQQTNPSFKLQSVTLHDKHTLAMLGRGLSVGVFQLEQEKMRGALHSMQPDSIEDIIALGALNRPGPMSNIPTYIEQKHGKPWTEKLPEKFEKILERTFGVLIYQEQVIETAQALAGYTAGSADLLRKAMGKKVKAEMDAQKEIFIKGAVERGISQDQAIHIFNLIEKFAGYGFNRAHAVAYGIISYYTAYLKAHYPAEFLASIMNIEMGDTDKLHMFVQDAKDFEIGIAGPDVNKSEAVFSVQMQDDKKIIVYGLGAIRNISLAAMNKICEERAARGPYKDIFDLLARIDSKVLNKRQLEYLIKSGALDSLHSNRKQLFESLDSLLAYQAQHERNQNSPQLSLFTEAQMSSVPKLAQTLDWDNQTRLNNECSAFGFYLLNHPLEIYKDYFASINLLGAAELKSSNNHAYGNFRAKIAAIPISLDTKMSPKGRYMICIMSTHSGMLKVFVFDEEVLQNNRELLYSKAPVVLDAEVLRDENSDRVLVRNVFDLKSYLDRTASTITITINSEDSAVLEQIKALMNVGGPGTDSTTIKHSSAFSSQQPRTKIILSLLQNGRRVRIELPAGTTCDLSKLAASKFPKGAVSINTIEG